MLFSEMFSQFDWGLSLADLHIKVELAVFSPQKS